jgi:hypothetical protein
MAMGTMGHRQLVSIDNVLLLLPLITMNLRGLKPLRPLSPSGCKPLVTRWPLWLYCGSEERRLSSRLALGPVWTAFSVVYSRDELALWSRDERPLAYSRDALG